jgi:hypothetical protein
VEGMGMANGQTGSPRQVFGVDKDPLKHDTISGKGDQLGGHVPMRQAAPRLGTRSNPLAAVPNVV